MKYFIDTRDVAKGSFPEEEVSPEQLVEIYSHFDKAAARRLRAAGVIKFTSPGVVTLLDGALGFRAEQVSFTP